MCCGSPGARWPEHQGFPRRADLKDMRRLRRFVLLPVLLLGVPLYHHFHPTHSWMEGKVRDQVNQEMAPVKATDVHCVVNGSVADCTVKTSNGHEFTVHVTKSGHTWTEQRAVSVY